MRFRKLYLITQHNINSYSIFLNTCVIYLIWNMSTKKTYSFTLNVSYSNGPNRLHNAAQNHNIIENRFVQANISRVQAFGQFLSKHLRHTCPPHRNSRRDYSTYTMSASSNHTWAAGADGICCVLWLTKPHPTKIRMRGSM